MAKLGWARNKEIFSQMLLLKAGSARGMPSPSLPLTILCLLFSFLLGWPAMALSAEARPEAAISAFFQKPATFDDCVKLALRQSPFFTKSSLEIEVRRLDEADSKADLIPSLYFISRYYPSQPNNPSVTDPQNYYLAFTTGDYNPLVAYLSLKAKKLITQIARLAHRKVISIGIERLGKSFLELSAAERMTQLQGTLTDLVQENLRSARERQKLGQIIPMEVQIISQEAAVAKAQREAVIANQARIREGIRKFLDLEPNQPLSLDLSQTRRQVLGDFDPAKASLEEAQKRDFDVRINKLTQELQTWNVTLAKMKFMPSFNLVLQTPDPVSSTINRGTFFSLGLNFPIFESFKRVRNIKRQNTILKQFVSEEGVKATELAQKWREVEGNLRTANTELQVARAKAELARLKKRQAETLYRTGEMDFTAFMAARREWVETQMEMISKSLEYDLYAVELRNLSGELADLYVHENNFTY